MKNFGFTEWFCIGVTLLCFGYFYWITALTAHGGAVGSEISEIKICVIGLVGSIVGYVVGSTKGSRDKDKMLGDAIAQKSEKSS